MFSLAVWGLVAMLCVVAVSLLIRSGVGWFDRDRRINRELGGGPCTPIGQIEGGAVRVTGRVSRVDDDLLVGPATGRRCLAFQITVEEESRGVPRVVARLGQARPFWIEDGTGRALVDPGEHVVMALSTEVAVDPHLSELLDEPVPPASEPFRTFARAHGVPLTVLGLDRHLRFREGLIEEGETLTVHGHASREVHARGEPAGPRQPPTVIVLRAAGAAHPLVISDAGPPKS
jgi:hypothetical protein